MRIVIPRNLKGNHPDPKQILDTFRSKYWLYERHWYFGCYIDDGYKEIRLFTIPYPNTLARVSSINVNNCQTTGLDNLPLFKNVQTLYTDNNVNLNQFYNVRKLDISDVETTADTDLDNLSLPHVRYLAICEKNMNFMVVTRAHQQSLDGRNRQLYLEELNRLSDIEIEHTTQTQPIEVFIVRRPLPFEMAEKALASRVNKQLDQLPTFSGKLNENVTKWLKDITNELNLAKFEDSQKLGVIQTYLVDDARKWFINNVRTFDTWSEFNEAIEKTYSLSFAKEVAISQVGQRHQGLDETVMHYYNDMMELFDVMDNRMSDSLKISYLKNGLKLSLKKEVSRKNPQTPSEFIKAAQEEESLDYSMTASMHNMEIQNNATKRIPTTTMINSPPIHQNYHYTSYPQRQFQHDGENYYARTTSSTISILPTPTTTISTTTMLQMQQERSFCS
ncbi:unnamed protein product [Didymodactylos carnosus]|uniref:Retrotransposon gag domain-containing protein n=2 Tax=Didymodactylos carnosus TaxID=1234261 RepID=A0A814ZLF1_9BILA|nr:unnamed protein product [Didymodactylos carnosus]CAF4007825.1 unnamed protein product [Didymodactylos carnosus]